MLLNYGLNYERKEKDISMRLSRVQSELHEESYYDFNCDAVFENLYENEFICEYQVSLYNNDGIQSEKNGNILPMEILKSA